MQEDATGSWKAHLCTNLSFKLLTGLISCDVRDKARALGDLVPGWLFDCGSSFPAAHLCASMYARSSALIFV